MQLNGFSLVAHLLLRLRLGLIVAGTFHLHLGDLGHVAVLVPGRARIISSIGGCDGNEAQQGSLDVDGSGIEGTGISLAPTAGWESYLPWQWSIIIGGPAHILGTCVGHTAIDLDIAIGIHNQWNSRLECDLG